MPWPIAAAALLLGGSGAAIKYYKSDADEKHDANINNRDNNNGDTVVVTDDLTEKDKTDIKNENELTEFLEKSGNWEKEDKDGGTVLRKTDKNNSKWTSSTSYNIKKPFYTRGGILRYPLEAMTESTDYLQIDIRKYEPVKERNDTFATIPGNRRIRRKSNVPGGLTNHSLVNKGTVLLQIPANIQDGNSTSYGESKLNTIVGAALGGGVDLMEGMGSALGGEGTTEQKVTNALAAGSGALQDAFNKSGVTSDAARSLITKKLATSAASIFGQNVSVNQLLARESGQIFNPNMELLFNGPTLRNFRFSFKMMPRSQDEAEQIKLIIRSFKMNMAPKVTTTTNAGTSLFLETPSVFELRYKSGRRNHPFLHKFKQCFLTDISVNYTAEGVYATYENKEPISMIMDLTFKELEPVYDIDYLDDSGSDRDNTVGF